jgi:hypothetical protein
MSEEGFVERMICERMKSFLGEWGEWKPVEPAPPEDWDFIKDSLDIIKRTQDMIQLYPDDFALRLSLESLTRFLDRQTGKVKQ